MHLQWFSILLSITADVLPPFLLIYQIFFIIQTEMHISYKFRQKLTETQYHILLNSMAITVIDQWHKRLPICMHIRVSEVDILNVAFDICKQLQLHFTWFSYKWWGVDVFICLQRDGNDLHMVQLMPVPPHHLLLH